MPKEPLQYEKLLTPREVATTFRVGPAQVRRWARKGLLESVITPGGHRRYAAAQVRKLLEAGDTR